MQAERTSSEEPQPTEQKGRLLRPSTAGVLKQGLEFYLAYDRDFMEVYFPEVARRRYVTWGDVFWLTDNQADALRPIMVESVRHFWKQEGKDKNRNVNLFTREPVDPDFVSYHARKAKYWTEALRDLCAVFGLVCPL